MRPPEVPTDAPPTAHCPRCGRPSISVGESVTGTVHQRHHLDNAGHVWLESWAVVG